MRLILGIWVSEQAPTVETEDLIVLVRSSPWQATSSWPRRSESFEMYLLCFFVFHPGAGPAGWAPGEALAVLELTLQLSVNISISEKKNTRTFSVVRD